MTPSPDDLLPPAGNVKTGIIARVATPLDLSRKQYEEELLRMQTELVYMQEWIVARGQRLVVLFEGRDTAGKDGVIKRITAFLNPRTCRVIAVPTPTERERTLWYFQRYTPHLPGAGEIALFDRSWYNRAGVEHVMGFCTQDQYEEFLRFCPQFEQALQNDGIILLKYWLSVSDAEQERRFKKRLSDPRKRWKFSPIDLQARARWVDYAEAKDRMFAYTDTDQSPWYVVEADDKRTARLNLIADLLSRVPYEHLDEHKKVKLPPRQRRKYVRPPKSTERLVPTRYTVRSS
ncbi:MAG TPA: polyphosphate kinase 2 [Solirubrobacteraceae bacterium]